jgi:hypothetical protein
MKVGSGDITGVKLIGWLIAIPLRLSQQVNVRSRIHSDRAELRFDFTPSATVGLTIDSNIKGPAERYFFRFLVAGHTWRYYRPTHRKAPKDEGKKRAREVAHSGDLELGYGINWIDGPESGPAALLAKEAHNSLRQPRQLSRKRRM